jgi:hypothetical protein
MDACATEYIGARPRACSLRHTESHTTSGVPLLTSLSVKRRFARQKTEQNAQPVATATTRGLGNFQMELGRWLLLQHMCAQDFALEDAARATWTPYRCAREVSL